MSSRSLAYWIALVGGAEVGLRGHLGDDVRLFHAGLWTVAALLAVGAWQLRRRGRGLAAPAVAVSALAAAGLSALAWAGIPAAATDPSIAFWEEHALERRVLTTPVDRGTVILFGQRIELEPGGMRRDALPAEAPPHAFRIVAVGGSTTFGATRTPQEQPWPALLQRRIDRLDCDTPVVVINAGRLGRALRGSIPRFENELAPLEPDLVVHYPSPQDIAGLMSEVSGDVVPHAAVPARASELLRRLEILWRERGVQRRFATAVAEQPEAPDLDAIPSASTYRRFLLELRRRGIEGALATASLAVDAGSAEARIRQHEALEARTRRMLLASRLHARFTRGLAPLYRADWIDTRPGLEGRSELFLDLFHLTQAGREQLADNVFEGLLPRLGRSEPGCSAPAARTSS